MSSLASALLGCALGARRRPRAWMDNGHQLLVELALVRVPPPAPSLPAHCRRPHSKRWIVDSATLRQARADDLLYVDSPDLLGFLNIFFANSMSCSDIPSPTALSPSASSPAVITKLGKKLQLRQRVIATATVFFRRFYIKNSYCETDPFIVIAACCYVAAKAEESPVHIKNVVTEARIIFSSQPFSLSTTCADRSYRRRVWHQGLSVRQFQARRNGVLSRRRA